MKKAILTIAALTFFLSLGACNAKKNKADVDDKESIEGMDSEQADSYNGELTYTIFLDIFQSMAKASDEQHHTPSKAVLDKYGLMMKERKITEYRYYAVIGDDIYLDNEDNIQSRGTWSIVINYGEDEPFFELIFKNQEDFNRFVARAKSYGLINMYYYEYYGDEGIIDLTMAALNPVKGKTTRVFTKEEADKCGVIGGIGFQINSVYMYFIGSSEIYVPNETLSLDNAAHLFCNYEKKIMEAEGYAYRMKIGDSEYWTKGCNIKKKGKDEYMAFDFGPGESSVVQLKHVDTETWVYIEVFSDKAIRNYQKDQDSVGYGYCDTPINVIIYGKTVSIVPPLG